jgi:hypothetical protein
MNLAAWRAYGAKLKVALDAGVCVVLREKHYECGWTDGGCLVAARATAQVTGGEVWAVATQHGAEHAVVRTPDGKGFLDVDGFATTQQLWTRWRKLFRAARRGPVTVRIGPAEADDFGSRGIPCRPHLVDQVAPLLPRLPGAPGSELDLDCGTAHLPPDEMPAPFGWDFISDCAFTYRGAEGLVRGAFTYTRSPSDAPSPGPWGEQLVISQVYAHPPGRGLGIEALRALRERFSSVVLRQRVYPTVVLTQIETPAGAAFGRRAVALGLAQVAIDEGDVVIATDAQELFGPAGDVAR